MPESVIIVQNAQGVSDIIQNDIKNTMKIILTSIIQKHT
jgi:hypothetical protein